MRLILWAANWLVLEAFTLPNASRYDRTYIGLTGLTLGGYSVSRSAPSFLLSLETSVASNYLSFETCGGELQPQIPEGFMLFCRLQAAGTTGEPHNVALRYHSSWPARTPAILAMRVSIFSSLFLRWQTPAKLLLLTRTERLRLSQAFFNKEGIQNCSFSDRSYVFYCTERWQFPRNEKLVLLSHSTISTTSRPPLPSYGYLQPMLFNLETCATIYL